MTLRSAAHGVVRTGVDFGKIMLFGAVLPITIAALLSQLG